jgi:hypothetical protein
MGRERKLFCKLNGLADAAGRPIVVRGNRRKRVWWSEKSRNRRARSRGSGADGVNWVIVLFLAC